MIYRRLTKSYDWLFGQFIGPEDLTVYGSAVT
jgi:hypothetical protein